MDIKKALKLAKDIKNIKIQGASNIILAVQDFFYHEIEKERKINLRDYLRVILLFWKLRPDEPGLKHFLLNLYLSLNDSKEDILKMILDFRKYESDSIKDVVDNFIEYLDKRKKYVFFTHCHSSIVEKAIKKAFDLNLVEFVVNSETRPLYQGRITSKNLSDYGIEVYHIVDSGHYTTARFFSQDYNILFLTGADVITKEGNVINKIGTSQINIAFKDLKIPHIVLTNSLKIDLVGNYYFNNIESRNYQEIWKDKPQKVKIINHAFDITLSKNIYKYVLEYGVFSNSELKKEFKTIDNKEYFALWDKFNKVI